MKIHLATFAMALLLGTSTLHAADDIQFLLADMSFTMFCDYPKGRAHDPQFAPKIESFLHNEGFKVLNYGRLPRNQYDLRIVGLNAKRQVIEFNSLRVDPGRYGVLLWVEPLTTHPPELEEKLQHFAATNLECEVKFVGHAFMPNDHRSIKPFNDKVNEIDELLRQLDKADINGRI